MITRHIKPLRSFALLALALTVALPAAARAAEPPIKEVISSRWGWDVNKTKQQAGAPQAERNVCAVPIEECQPAASTAEPGGFDYANGVAVAPAGEVYVADTNNARVEEFGSKGELLRVFGGEGQLAGEMSHPHSLAVDPITHDVWAQDYLNYRVDEYTATGEFVLMIGKEVNETKDRTPGATSAEKNRCTEEEIRQTGVKCKAGVQNALGNSEPGAFNYENTGNVIQAGGPEDLLYVGDEHRVQEFNDDGMFVREISLTSISSLPKSEVEGLAVDKTGDVFVIYSNGRAFADNVIHEFGPTGLEMGEFVVAPHNTVGTTSTELALVGIAIDPAGRLGVLENEHYTVGVVETHVLRGSLYEVAGSGLHLVTEFDNEALRENGENGGSSAVAFGANDDLYAAGENEVVAYSPLPVADLTTEGFSCAQDGETGGDVTLGCTIDGEANPEGVSETEAFFQWGRTQALEEATSRKKIENTGPVHGSLAGLRPNETMFYRLAGYDHNNSAPESALSGETETLHTPTVAPRIVGEASASFVKPYSAVLSGELNPENASTEYRFQYGQCAVLSSCPGLASTAALVSSEYGTVATTGEPSGLQPGSTYRYRLVAVNGAGQESAGPEASFVTTPAPSAQASTGPASLITASTAVISGSVNPDGQTVTYSFALGLDEGAATQLGTVSSGTIDGGASAVAESLALSGLQSGTTYAYRIIAKNGDGQETPGAIATFTTAGLPAVLVSPSTLPLLAMPNIVFPQTGGGAPTTKVLTNTQKLANALKACKKTKNKRARASCIKKAQKKYAPAKKAPARKKKGAHK